MHFRNLRKILRILKKNITIVTLLFRKLLSPKTVVTSMSNSSCFRTPFGCQRISGPKLTKQARQHFLPNCLLIPDILSWKKSLLVRSEILGLCFNTLTAYHMNSRQNREKFLQQYQVQLSPKPLTFREIFIRFLKSP